MAKKKEIKFQDRCGDLRGRQNGMTFWILRDNERDDAYYVAVHPGVTDLPEIHTAGHQSFDLAGAKKFCQRIAAGEIKLEDLQAACDAEDAAREQAVMREVTEKAKKFHARLDAMGLSYRELLELEVLRSGLGSMGHNILMGYERGEGWPVDLALDPGGAT